MKPLLSVIIPVYNCERYVAEAIESVLRQHYDPTEIIVVNDGSTDGTLFELQKFGNKIKIINQENKGQAAARNVGLRTAKGEIVGMLDADDVWPLDHVSLLLPFLAEGSEYDMARGKTRYIKEEEERLVELNKNLFLEALVGACLYKKSLIEKVGLFDEEMRQGEDFDWAIRLKEHGTKEKRIEETTLIYRRHENNLTNSQEVVKMGQVQAFRNKLARAKTREQ